MDNKTNDWQGKMIGRYQVIRLLGRGGMGTVWLATDTQLRRQVALKLLPAVLLQNRGYLNDFAHEAHASASLEHPHILAIHDFGEHETPQGQIIPYLVMPYVAGGTLRALIDARNSKIPVLESLRYLRQAGLAIDYAHSKQILHRDIKPANILLDKEWLLLSDFGIAKILNSISRHDKTYAGAGTPEYMAPEQIASQAGPASDRYSLAIIAYQLFTGQRPFHGDTPYDTFAMQLKSMPIPPRQLNSSIPHGIERVLLQGLAKQPEQRPPSCVEFVDALENGWISKFASGGDPDSTMLSPWSKRWQEMSMVQPAIPKPPEQQWQSMPEQRPTNSAPAQLMQLGFDQKPLSTTYSTQQPVTPYHPASMPPAMITTPWPQAPQEEASQQLAQKPGRRKLLIGGLGAAAVLVAGGTTAAILLNNKSHIISPPAPSKPLLGPKKLIPAAGVLQLTGHTDEVWNAQWDPSGRYLLTSGKGTNVMLWDIITLMKKSATVSTIATPTQMFTVAGIDFKDTNNGICWSADGHKLVVAFTNSKTAYVLDTAKLDTPISYADSSGNDSHYYAVCSGPEKASFTMASYAASTSSEAQVWQFGKTNGPQNRFVVDSKNKDSLAHFIGVMQWSTDGKTLAALDTPFVGSFSLVLWPNKPDAISQILALPVRNDTYTSTVLADTLAWSPTDPNLLLTSNADVAHIWDVRHGKILLTLGAKTDPSIPLVSSMSWSPNGRYIAGSYTPIGGLSQGINKKYNPTIYIWDIEQLKKTVKSPDAVQEPAQTFEETGSIRHTQTILGLQWSPDGRYLATSSLDKTVIVWKVDGG